MYTHMCMYIHIHGYLCVIIVAIVTSMTAMIIMIVTCTITLIYVTH